MKLKFDITEEEFSEFTIYSTKRTLFKSNWKVYGLIALLLLVGFNIYNSTKKEVFDGENGTGYSISYIQSIGEWLLLIGVFSVMFTFIIRGKLTSKIKLHWKHFLYAIPISLLVFSGLASLFDEGSPWKSIMLSISNWLLLLSIFGLLWTFIMGKIKVTTSIKEDRELILGEREMIFETDKVQMASTTSFTNYKWNAFKKWEQTTNLFLLFLSNNVAIMIPKRAFESPQQLADFEILLKQNISDLQNPKVLDA